MAVTAALTSFFSFLLGYLVYWKNPEKEENLLFLLMSVFLGIWAFIAVFIYSARDLSRFTLLYRSGFVFQMLYLGTFLHFAAVITGFAHKRSQRIFLIYIPCIAAVPFFIAGTGSPEYYFQVGTLWCFGRRYLISALLYPTAVWVTYYTTSLFFYFKRAGRSAMAEDRQLFMTLGTIITVILLGTILEGIVFPVAFDIPSIGPDLLFKFTWLLCVGLLVDRHDFMAAPKKLEDLALTELPEYAVFVLDDGCTIRKINRVASLLLSMEPKHLEGTHIENIIPSGERLFQEMERLKGNGDSSLAGIVDIRESGTSRILMDLKITPLRGQSGTITGYIVLGKPLRKKRHLETIFNLTHREIEIIEEVIRGRTNVKTARLLHISERTVKSHLTHIFDKMGVENRIQLYSLLKSNYYISDHSAEKNLLILQHARN